MCSPGQPTTQIRASPVPCQEKDNFPILSSGMFDVATLFFRRWCTSILRALDWRVLSSIPSSARPKARLSACWRRLTLASPRLPQESSHGRKRRSPARSSPFPPGELRGTSRRYMQENHPCRMLVIVLECGCLVVSTRYLPRAFVHLGQFAPPLCLLLPTGCPNLHHAANDPGDLPCKPRPRKARDEALPRCGRGPRRSGERHRKGIKNHKINNRCRRCRPRWERCRSSCSRNGGWDGNA